MTEKKDLKRRVRARMAKTGESYTAARARVVAGAEPRPGAYAELAGMSDEAVSRKTGLTWADWVTALDGMGATSKTHRDIARAVQEGWPEVGVWWAQTVTVGYERIRGLREKGQQRTTRLYEANKSRTFAVPLPELYRAFSEKRRRAHWLGDVALTIRTSQKHRSMRITWPDGTDVQAWFTDKGPGKSQVAIQHAKLPSQRDVDRAKAFWAEHLASLGASLGQRGR